jgi:hypothetical protein
LHEPVVRSQTRILRQDGQVMSAAVELCGEPTQERPWAHVSSYEPVSSVEPCRASEVTKLVCPRRKVTSCAMPADQLRSRKCRPL